MKIALKALYAVCLLMMGFAFGTISANRRTLSRALEVMDQLKVPVEGLNAQGVAAIVGVSASPRWRRHAQEWVEEYEPGAFVYLKPFWVKETP